MRRVLLSIFFLAFLVPPLQAATIAVTTETDEVDAAGDGCSLREALEAVNNDSSKDGCTHDGSGGTDRIILPAGTYPVTGATGDDSNVSGDFDIEDDLIIRGEDKDTTIIDGDGVDRVLHVLNDANLTISNVSISNGTVTGEGGGLYLVAVCPSGLSLSVAILSN